MDRALLRLLRTRGHTPGAEAAARAYARAGENGALWLGIAALALNRRTAAGAMALTRPYLGVHYPSDVVAGALLGWALEKLA